MSLHQLFDPTAASTLAMLLPADELEVLRILWARGPLTVREVDEQIRAQRREVSSIAQSVIIRLTVTGLLQRSPGRDAQDGGYRYAPAVDEHTFVAQQLASLLDAILRDYPAALTSYLDA